MKTEKLFSRVDDWRLAQTLTKSFTDRSQPFAVQVGSASFCR
jgi:hypothetical protein